MGSDIEIMDEVENRQANSPSDWEMDKDSFGMGKESEVDLMDEEPMHLILKTSSPPNPTLTKQAQRSLPNLPLPTKSGATSAITPADLAAESTSKTTVTSAIRRGLMDGVKKGLFQFFSQGTAEQTQEYHARETERNETIMQDDQHRVTVTRLQQAEIKRERARIRKQKEREIRKRSEMQLGLRSPGGRKRRVSVKSIVSKSTS
jgi:hypothetical protein